MVLNGPDIMVGQSPVEFYAFREFTFDVLKLLTAKGEKASTFLESAGISFVDKNHFLTNDLWVLYKSDDSYDVVVEKIVKDPSPAPGVVSTTSEVVILKLSKTLVKAVVIPKGMQGGSSNFCDYGKADVPAVTNRGS